MPTRLSEANYETLANPSAIFADINRTLTQPLREGGKEILIPGMLGASLELSQREPSPLFAPISSNPAPYFSLMKGNTSVFGTSNRGRTAEELVAEQNLIVAEGKQPGTVSWDLAKTVGCAVVSTSTVFTSADGRMVFETVSFDQEPPHLLQVIHEYLPKIAFVEVIRSKFDGEKIQFYISKVFFDRALLPEHKAPIPEDRSYLFKPDSRVSNHVDLRFIERLVSTGNVHKVVIKLRHSAMRSSVFSSFSDSLVKRGLNPLYEAGDAHIMAAGGTKGTAIQTIYKNMPWIDPQRTVSLGNSEIDATMADQTSVFIQCGDEFEFKGDRDRHIQIAKNPLLLPALLSGRVPAGTMIE